MTKTKKLTGLDRTRSTMQRRINRLVDDKRKLQAAVTRRLKHLRIYSRFVENLKDQGRVSVEELEAAFGKKGEKSE